MIDATKLPMIYVCNLMEMPEHAEALRVSHLVSSGGAG